MSNAFYFTDPEGNGVELYWDRDRTEWSWTHGMVDMATMYVDPNAFLQEHLTAGRALDAAAARPGRVGHVHLSVGDVASARAFYVDQLGFETTAGFGEALFVSAGGYHHHMAMNTWNSRGAGRRQLALGLGLVRIEVPGADDLGALGRADADTGVQTARRRPDGRVRGPVGEPHRGDCARSRPDERVRRRAAESRAERHSSRPQPEKCR